MNPLTLTPLLQDLPQLQSKIATKGTYNDSCSRSLVKKYVYLFGQSSEHLKVPPLVSILRDGCSSIAR